MSKSPAFQFYPDDYLGDDAVELMTLEQQGAYMRLLCHAWKQDEPGVIPDDDRWLAGVTRLCKKWARSRQAIAAAFDTMTRPGFWVQKRMVKEAEKQAEWHAKSAAGGRASAAKRFKGGSTTLATKPQARTPRPVEPKGNTPVSCLQSPDSINGGFTPIPPTLAVEPLLTLLGDFRKLRIEKKKPLTETAWKYLLKKLEKIGNERAIAALEHTLAHGWEGVREPDDTRIGGGNHRPQAGAGASQRRADEASRLLGSGASSVVPRVEVGS
jgi:uncharacterized protein YdaU (DUF1376 family)